MGKMSRDLFLLSGIILLFVFSFNNCSDENPTKYDPPTLEVNFPAIDEYPSFSPDGLKIMYYHLGITDIKSDGSFTINSDSSGLWIISIDSTNPQQLMKGINIYASFSPNGDWIVYNKGGQIFKVPLTSDSINISELVQLTFEGRNFFPSWSPDGQWIVYDSNVDSPNGMNFIWKMRADGTQKTRIAYEPTKGEIRMPSWSPDGKSIVHQRFIGVGSPEIFSMTNSGSDYIRLTYNDYSDSYPKYSPEGNKIIFQSQADSDVPKVWTMDTQGDNLLCLTIFGGINPDYSITQKIAYIHYDYRTWQKKDKTNGTLWIMDPNGNNKRQLTFGPYR